MQGPYWCKRASVTHGIYLAPDKRRELAENPWAVIGVLDFAMLVCRIAEMGCSTKQADRSFGRCGSRRLCEKKLIPTRSKEKRLRPTKQVWRSDEISVREDLSDAGRSPSCMDWESKQADDQLQLPKGYDGKKQPSRSF